MKTNTRVYYISAAKKDLPVSTNLDRHSELRSKITKLGYTKTECIGMYKGVPELSLIITGINNNTESDLLQLAKEYEQECIMCVYGIDSTAELISSSNNREVIGRMVCLGENEGALKGRDYSFVNEKFYVVE